MNSPPASTERDRAAHEEEVARRKAGRRPKGSGLGCIPLADQAGRPRFREGISARRAQPDLLHGGVFGERFLPSRVAAPSSITPLGFAGQRAAPACIKREAASVGKAAPARAASGHVGFSGIGFSAAAGVSRQIQRCQGRRGGPQCYVAQCIAAFARGLRHIRFRAVGFLAVDDDDIGDGDAAWSHRTSLFSHGDGRGSPKHWLEVSLVQVDDVPTPPRTALFGPPRPPGLAPCSRACSMIAVDSRLPTRYRKADHRSAGAGAPQRGACDASRSFRILLLRCLRASGLLARLAGGGACCSSSLPRPKNCACAGWAASAAMATSAGMKTLAFDYPRSPFRAGLFGLCLPGNWVNRHCRRGTGWTS